jgi:hypothetical protein
MSFQKVCRVCNKFLKDTKRSNALYCGKSCKNKALALRKSESVLNSPQIAKTITPDNPLYDAPNLYELIKKQNEIKLQYALHEQHSRHIREIDKQNDNLRQLKLAESSRKQENIDKMGLFFFTNIIEPMIIKVKSQSDLSSKNIKPQSGFMPLTADDIADF